MLGTAAPLPFNVFPEDQVGEDKRLTNRFLDLRRQRMHRNIVLRSEVARQHPGQADRLASHEYQTPILTASSPEGARDFLVPSGSSPATCSPFRRLPSSSSSC